MPFEAVRDFFFAHRNYLMRLIVLPKHWLGRLQSKAGHLQDWLQYRLQARHGVLVLRAHVGTAEKAGSHRRAMRSRAPCMWHRS
jgi:predicted transcriptional regulator